MATSTESEIRESARANLIAAAVGLISEQELVAWADEVIQTLPDPPYFLTAISLGDDKGLIRLDRVDLVQDKPNNADCRLLVAEVLRRIDRGWLSVDDLEGIVLKIETYVDINSPFRLDLSWVSDELNLANMGFKDRQQSRLKCLESSRNDRPLLAVTSQSPGFVDNGCC